MPKFLPSNPSAGDQVDVGYFDDAYDGIQNYTNFGIETSDLQGTSSTARPSEKGWVKTQHIFKPEFYGSPSPRMDGVSCSVYHRHIDNAIERRSIHHSVASENDWVWVPGLVATVKVSPPYERSYNNGTAEANFTSNNHVATVLSSFHAFDMGGSGSEYGESVEDSLDGRRSTGVSEADSQNGSYEFKHAATFALFVNDKRLTSTDRFLYTGTRWNWMGARKQFSIMKNVNLPIGVHNIGIRVKMEPLEHSMVKHAPNGNGRSFGSILSSVTPDFIAPTWKHVFVGGRNLVIHVDRR